MEFEIWKDVVGYEGLYIISNYGRLKTVPREFKNKLSRNIQIKEKFITVRLNNFGYFDTRLYKGGKKKSAFIHRLIAEPFIPNPNKKPFVNHKNGIKTDNRLSNLEWCTHSENIKHAYFIGLSKNPRISRRKVIDMCTNEVYNSMREASKVQNIPYNSLKNMLKGIRRNDTCLRLAA